MTDKEQMLITKYDLMYEARLVRVESSLEYLLRDVKDIKTDLRWMLGLMFTFSTIILGLMAKGFHWM